jgi:hypothetical protein
MSNDLMIVYSALDLYDQINEIRCSADYKPARADRDQLLCDIRQIVFDARGDVRVREYDADTDTYRVLSAETLAVAVRLLRRNELALGDFDALINSLR